jgi:heparan-alpha-glucosaminide N-acetyltransferase
MLQLASTSLTNQLFSYVALMLGLWVPSYSYVAHYTNVTAEIPHDITHGEMVVTVPCDTRGDLSPACSAARLVDDWILGSQHLYDGAEFQRLPECSSCSPAMCAKTFFGSTPPRAPWCDARLDPEGVLSSFPVIFTAMCGYHFGSVLLHVKVLELQQRVEDEYMY